MKKKSVLDLKRISQEEFKRVEKISLTVILDYVRSLNNIGSVFRTADAFRVECIYLCGITATPPHTDIHKTALGAERKNNHIEPCRSTDDSHIFDKYKNKPILYPTISYLPHGCNAMCISCY